MLSDAANIMNAAIMNTARQNTVLRFYGFTVLLYDSIDCKPLQCIRDSTELSDDRFISSSDDRMIVLSVGQMTG